MPFSNDDYILYDYETCEEHPWMKEIRFSFESDEKLVHIHVGKKLILIPFDDFDEIVDKYLKARR